MWMGLYLSLLQVVLYIIVVVNHDTTYWHNITQLLLMEHIILPVYNATLFELVVKGSWSSGAALEQSSHLLLDGIQTDTEGVVGCVGMS